MAPFETLVIILLSVVIILQVLNTTAMTVFIYLGWKHDQNLDAKAVHLGKGIRLILESIEGSKWKTIESAPLDGTQVILYSERTEEYEVAAFTNGYWWAQEGNGVPEPTHWMPLPEVPHETD